MNDITKYAVVRIGSKLDKALLGGGKKSVSPSFSTRKAANLQRKASKSPDLFRIAIINN